MGYKVILYGLGEIYNRIFNCIKYYETTGEIEVVAVTDKYFCRVSNIDDHSVIQPNDIINTEYDYIILLSSRFFDEIRQELMGIGVAPQKILSYRFLEIPNVNVDRYIKLKNSNLSIVSNNCWGGVIYKTLGMECLSPFKNLFVLGEDYLKLLKRLPYYLSCTPILYKYIYNDVSKLEYPVLLLDDILIHCNHDTDADEAISKWERRNKKFNFDNIFVEMYTRNKERAEQFARLNQYPKKICFVPFHNKNLFMMELEMYDGQNEFWETVNSNAGGGKNCLKYNPVDLLSMEKCIRSE